MKKANKNKYEKPAIIPLGELAKGSGVCDAGSGGNPPDGGGQPHCYSGVFPGANKKCDTGTGGNN